MSREGNEETGQGGKNPSCGRGLRGSDLARRQRGVRVGETKEERLIKKRGEERGGRGFRVKEMSDGLMQEEKEPSTIQLATKALSPRHCQPDNRLISLLFTPV